MNLTIRTQAIYWAAATLLFFLVLWLLGGVLLPFLVGGAIAYFLDPVADRLERAGLSRAWATSVITLVALLAMVLAGLSLVPLLIQQLQALIQAAPGLIQQLQALLVARFPDLADSTSTLSQTLNDLGALVQSKGAELAQGVLNQALGVIGWFVFILVVPVVAFYMLLDWDPMVARIDALLPREHRATIRQLGREIDAALAGFVRGQTTVCLVMGTYYAIGLIAGGLQFGLIVGALAGLVTFIPYLGAILGGSLAIGLALVQFWGDWPRVIVIVAIFAVGQFMEGNVITPRLVGRSVGLHPVWLLFALSAMGTLFGFVGLLVAVPTAAAIGVVIRFLVGRYQESLLYLGSGTPDGASPDPEHEL